MVILYLEFLLITHDLQVFDESKLVLPTRARLLMISPVCDRRTTRTRRLPTSLDSPQKSSRILLRLKRFDIEIDLLHD